MRVTRGLGVLPSNLLFIILGSYIIQPSRLEGVLCFGERQHRPFQWPCVSLVSPGICKYRFDSSGKVLILPLKQSIHCSIFKDSTVLLTTDQKKISIFVTIQPNNSNHGHASQGIIILFLSFDHRLILLPFFGRKIRYL